MSIDECIKLIVDELRKMEEADLVFANMIYTLLLRHMKGKGRD